MKYTWTENDIICGRIVCKPDHEFSKRKNVLERTFKPSGWTAKWTLKIAWFAGKYTGRYCLVAMTDGMIPNGKSKAELVKQLNTEKLIPMPHSWLMATMEYLRDCYEHH